MARPQIAALAVVFALATSAAMAQSATGQLQGTIVDGSGAPLPGVTVTITNTATGVMREASATDSGSFVAAHLPVGRYEVQASAQGFATRRQLDVDLQPGQVITLRLELGIARDPETITVAGTAPMIEATKSQVDSVISSIEVEHLSVRDNNALALALLTPGVMPGVVNRILVDGAERSRPLGGAYWIGQEATHGLQVSTNAYTAEYGRATGAVIQVATKSGANELNGSAFEFFGNTLADRTVNQFGGSVGGPLMQNRHFGYAIYEGMRLATDEAAVVGLPTRHNQHLFLAKTDHRLSDVHHLSLRYSSEGLRASRLAAGGLEGSTHAFTATGTSAIGSTLVNEARLHAGRAREAIEMGSEASVKPFQFADTLSWFRGTHTLKAGFDMQADRIASAFPGTLGSTIHPEISEYSLFLQDEWRTTQELTFNIGLRYDAQTFAQREARSDTASTHSDYNNFGPRLGFAWAPQNKRFVVRGGYGVVYGRTPWFLVALANAFEAGYEIPRVQQASTGFEWEWMPNAAVSMNYLMLRGAQSGYDGISMEMTRRHAQGHQYRLSYTLGNGDEIGRHGRFTGSVIYASNRMADRFDGLMRALVSDWMLSAVYSIQSAVAFSTRTLPASISLDPRIARDIALEGDTRITVLWEAFNLLNRPNEIGLNDTPYDVVLTRRAVDPLFAPTLNLRDSRTTRVAVRFSF